MSAAPRALFLRFPRLPEQLPHVPLARVATPVEPLSLTGLRGELWIKRDDLSGARYGGNKVRKLEFLLGRAEDRGVRRVITAGAMGSHHALATAVHGRARGLKVTLCLSPQETTPHVRRNLLLDHAVGAELVHVPRIELLPAVLRAQRLRYLDEGAMIIAPGGSDPVGTLGYVDAALELAEQVEAGMAPRPDVVHVACGTMGTAAGLAVGFALADLPIRVRAVRVVGRIVTGEGRLRRLVRSTLHLLQSHGVSVPPAAAAHALLEMDHEQFGGGYGEPTRQGREAGDRFREAGIELDDTYTGKAGAGCLVAAEREPHLRHLFWHTLSATLPEAGGEVRGDTGGEPSGGAEGSTSGVSTLPDPGRLPEPFRRLLAG